MMLGWTLVLACTLTACLGQERRAMGFMGVRGKKDGGDGGAVDVEESSVTSGGAEFAGSPLDGDDHHSMTMMMSPHHPPFLLFDRPSSFMDKRGPSMMGFQGVRGKKDDDSGSPSSMFIESDGSLMAVSPYSGYEEWKRAPAMGFQGVRGKKAPMGFTGVRGKKENYGWLEEDKRAPAAGFFGVRGKKGPSSSGFFGMRGKKGPSSSSFFGMRGKRGKNEEPEDIETLLQALKDSPMRQDFNGLMESRVRRFASPQDSQSTSEVNMMQ